MDFNQYCALETFNQHDIIANTSFAKWQALGYDLHGIYSDPRFAGATYGLGFYSSWNDLHLRTNSPGRGMGCDLSGYFSCDFSGYRRTGAWDIGAYQTHRPVAPGSVGRN